MKPGISIIVSILCLMVLFAVLLHIPKIIKSEEAGNAKTENTASTFVAGPCDACGDHAWNTDTTFVLNPDGSVQALAGDKLISTSDSGRTWKTHFTLYGPIRSFYRQGDSLYLMRSDHGYVWGKSFAGFHYFQNPIVDSSKRN